MSDRRPVELVVVGGGEHARVVIEAAHAQSDRFLVVGFVDARTSEATERMGVPWLGEDKQLLAAGAGGRLYVVGVGVTGVSPARRRLVERYRAAGARFATVIHPRAVVSPSAVIEEGTVVCAGAVVNTGARVGAHSIINTSAVVEHDVMLGAFVHAAPASAIGGGASIGAGTYLGLGCRVRDHVKVGSDVQVGMGAVVVGDVPDGGVVVGVPAREMR